MKQTLFEDKGARAARPRTFPDRKESAFRDGLLTLRRPLTEIYLLFRFCFP